MCSALILNAVPLLVAADRTGVFSRHTHRTDPVPSNWC